MKSSCERFLRSLEDTKWIIKHFDSIKKKYHGEFIAVLDRKVVAHHKEIEELMAVLEKEYPGEIEFISTEFIGKKEIKVILWS
jgi:hypothetical protein